MYTLLIPYSLPKYLHSTDTVLGITKMWFEGCGRMHAGSMQCCTILYQGLEHWWILAPARTKRHCLWIEATRLHVAFRSRTEQLSRLLGHEQRLPQPLLSVPVPPVINKALFHVPRAEMGTMAGWVS